MDHRRRRKRNAPLQRDPSGIEWTTHQTRSYHIIFEQLAFPLKVNSEGKKITSSLKLAITNLFPQCLSQFSKEYKVLREKIPACKFVKKFHHSFSNLPSHNNKKNDHHLRLDCTSTTTHTRSPPIGGSIIARLLFEKCEYYDCYLRGRQFVMWTL